MRYCPEASAGTRDDGERHEPGASQGRARPLIVGRGPVSDRPVAGIPPWQNPSRNGSSARSGASARITARRRRATPDPISPTTIRRGPTSRWTRTPDLRPFELPATGRSCSFAQSTLLGLLGFLWPPNGVTRIHVASTVTAHDPRSEDASHPNPDPPRGTCARIPDGHEPVGRGFGEAHRRRPRRRQHQLTVARAGALLGSISRSLSNALIS
jgi:hypothetical protein